MPDASRKSRKLQTRHVTGIKTKKPRRRRLHGHLAGRDVSFIGHAGRDAGRNDAGRDGRGRAGGGHGRRRRDRDRGGVRA